MENNNEQKSKRGDNNYDNNTFPDISDPSNSR